jgi:hypothetical protein
MGALDQLLVDIPPVEGMLVSACMAKLQRRFFYVCAEVSGDMLMCVSASVKVTDSCNIVQGSWCIVRCI